MRKNQTSARKRCEKSALVAVLVPIAVALAQGQSTSTTPAQEPAQQPKVVECPVGQRAYGGDCVIDPVILKFRKPKYPKIAKKNRVEGRVVLRAVITRDGTVVDPVVQECTTPGFGFEAAAVKAVKQWRYVPSKVDGETKSVYFDIVVNFSH